MLTILFALAAGFTADPPAPALRPASPAVSLGEVKAGPIAKASATFTNYGPMDLVILGADGGCGCVRAAVAKGTLRPGESAEVAVEFNTLTPPAGTNAWRVTVKYRDAAGDQSADVRFTAEVVREITVAPPAVAFSTTGTAEQAVTITDSRANPLTVTAAAANTVHLTAAVRPGSNGRIIDVKLLETAPVGHFDGVVVLATSDPACPELRIPVRASKRAAGGAEATPDAVSLKFAAGQTEASARVLVRRPGGGNVEVEAAECDDPAVTLKWSGGPLAVAVLRVSVAGGGTGSADVRIKLASPAGAVVTVPVAWGR